jgi:hypothetical protein
MNTAKKIWDLIEEFPDLLECLMSIAFFGSMTIEELDDFMEDAPVDVANVHEALTLIRTGRLLEEEQTDSGVVYRVRFEDGAVLAYRTDSHNPGTEVWLEKRHDVPAPPPPVITSPSVSASDPRYYIKMSSTASFVRDGYRDTGRSTPVTRATYEFWVRRGAVTLLDRHCCENADSPALRMVFQTILTDAGLDPGLALRLWQDLKLGDRKTEVSFTLSELRDWASKLP